MYNMLTRYRDTNLLSEQTDVNIRSGIAINKEQVLESFVDNVDGNILTIITPIEEYVKGENIPSERLTNIKEILPIGIVAVGVVYRDENVNVTRLIGSYVSVTTQDGMMLI